MVERANQLPDRARVTESDHPNAGDGEAMRPMRERFAAMESFWSEIFNEGHEDDKFVAGKQWPANIVKEREGARRPILTYNLLPSFTRQITNKVRQERPQVRVTPVESDRFQTPDVANVQGTKDYSLADVYMGIIRNIEHLSRAEHAYDTALKHAVHHGFGFFVLRNRECRSDPFVQELVIDRIKNSYQVLMDPDAQMADYSDAQDAFVFSDIARSTFEKKYPGFPASPLDTSSGHYMERWYQEDLVRVAEYRWIEYVDDEVIQLSNGKVVYVSEVEKVLDELERDQGIYIEEVNGRQLRKPVKRPVCMWQKITGTDIIDGPLELPFQNIPIFPVLGEELVVEGQTLYQSAIRDAKDPQRSYNYWRTAAAESVALAPRQPIMATEKQTRGYEHLYETANTENHPVLYYNHVDGVDMPRRLQLSGVAAAELSNATQDGIDIQTIIGLHDASLGRESNEKSGKAIVARQNQGLMATFEFPDNLNRALEAMGRCLVYAIPRIYDTQRVMRIRLPDDTEDFVEINQLMTDDETGEEVVVNDLNYGRYDVVVETGPNYATQRQEALEVQMELIKSLPPEIAQNVIHLIVKNMALPGSEEIGRILRKMLPDELKSEDERAADLPKGVIFDDQGNPVYEETGEPYQRPPTPQEQMAQAQQQLEAAEIEAKHAKAEADKANAEAKIKEAEAKILELQQAGAGDGEAPDYSGILGEIETIIQEAMAEHEANDKAHAGNIEETVTDAIALALERVNRYVERQVGPLRQGLEATQKGPGEETPAEEEQEADNVVQLPTRVRVENIERNDGGRISSAEVVVLDTAQNE